MSYPDQTNLNHLLRAAMFLVPIAFACAPATSQKAPPSAAQLKVSATAPSSWVNALDSDPRLTRPLTLRRDSITIERALAAISELSGIQCAAENIELRAAPVAFRFRATPLKDAMEGIARLGPWEWRKDSENWVLRFRYDPHALDAARPHTKAEAEVYRLGKQFLDQFAGLSAQDQNLIGFDGSSRSQRNHPGMAFGSLPGPMQNTVQGMLGAQLENNASIYSTPSRLSMGSLSSCTIDLQVTGVNEGINSYSVDISDGSATVAASFAVFGDPREGYQVVPMSDIGPAKDYDDNAEGTSRQKALLTDSRLGENVSLAMKNATFAEALQQLGVKCNIAFAAVVWTEKPGVARKEFKLVNVPLKEVLDTLTSQYGFIWAGNKLHYTWGETPHDVILFHISRDAVIAN